MKLNELTQNLFILPQLNEGLLGYELDLIEKECQPFIKEIGGVENIHKYQLLRGVKNLEDSISIRTARLEDRLPKDTHPRVHKWLNDYFIGGFGVPFRNGIFATGSNEIASGYGSVGVIFPIGEFKFCWHETIVDLYQDLDDDPDIAIKELQSYLQHYPYRSNDLRAAILAGKEIMIWCEKYYITPRD